MQLVDQQAALRQVAAATGDLGLAVAGPGDIAANIERWSQWFEGLGYGALSWHPRWLLVLQEGMGVQPYCLEARQGDQIRGLLTLAYCRSVLFGRYLISLPYVNYGGVLTDEAEVADALVTEASYLSDRMRVKHLQLRHEQPLSHWRLDQTLTDKVNMRLDLPAKPGVLWDSLKAKVRNQVRKGTKCGVEICWGTEDLLDDFYRVFAHNMRDLGTPVFSRGLFAGMLRHFGERCEICIARHGGQAVGGAILLHGTGTTEVPSASTLRSHNHTNANMLMYWHLLERAIERGQDVFDFGRSSVDSGPHQFKRQWGAQPFPASWQFYIRDGQGGAARLQTARYDRFIRLWQRLPVSVSMLLGPTIVRGIP